MRKVALQAPALPHCASVHDSLQLHLLLYTTVASRNRCTETGEVPYMYAPPVVILQTSLVRHTATKHAIAYNLAMNNLITRS
jgi:hypothetical protein